MNVGGMERLIRKLANPHSFLTYPFFKHIICDVIRDKIGDARSMSMKSDCHSSIKWLQNMLIIEHFFKMQNILKNSDNEK